ncbi:hypothetical protein C8Q73DRAFT_791128 [Cubamyces lactineus]|nr:hypothetical protein C8Q73DRAFT_791128 [Cubamyces lactineus]
MAIYRGYLRPGDPVSRVQFLSVETGSQQASNALKRLCHRGANQRIPASPAICPRCHFPACFTARITYKADYAGAWAMICLGCKRAHFPTQWGPPEEQLEEIERQRQEDAEEALTKRVNARNARLERARKSRSVGEAKKAQARTTKKTKKPTKPFGIVNNVLDSKKSEVRKGRDITICLWYKENELPIKTKIGLSQYTHLRLDDHPWIQEACLSMATSPFEHWKFDVGQWELIPWATANVNIGLQDTIFVRVKDLRCTGLGHELRVYEDRDRARFLSLSKSPVSIVEREPTNCVYFAIWHRDNQGPVIHQRVRVKDQDLEGVHWRGPPEVHGEWPVCYWQEATSKWHPYEGGPEERGVLDPDARVILLRRPDVLLLHGLGEVLEFMENDSAGRRILAADSDLTMNSSARLVGVSTPKVERDSTFDAGGPVSCAVKIEREASQTKRGNAVRKQLAEVWLDKGVATSERI